MSKERPILFSDEMVRAILSGAKTQTRRVVKFTNNGMFICNRFRGAVSCCKMGESGPIWNPYGGAPDEPLPQKYIEKACPYGTVGDYLWVRETWAPKGTTGKLYYRADGELGSINVERWKPSIHMPRRLSRITLEITGVRVERLQDISEEDADREGFATTFEHSHDCGHDSCALAGGIQDCDGEVVSGIDTFRQYWDSLNAKRAPWSSNPWVWVLELKKCEERHK